MKVLRRLMCMSLFFSLTAVAAFSQQANPPRERVQRTPTMTTPGTQAERPAEEPAPAERTAPRPGGEPRPQPQPTPTPGAPEGGESAGRPFHFDMTEVAPVQTHHSIRVDGRQLNYTATAGRLPIKDAEGRIEAEMFFVAYTLDGADAGSRPLTFAYNGGPGAASIWLHMGALGPKKIVMQPEGWMPEAPYRFTDNPNTPLDKTDVVFIDAIGTGFSRPADNAAARKYENPTGDVEAFGEFIRLYVSRYERWSSPLYLFGESYGTTRSAGIAGYLASRGIAFNGIGLLSMVLNFETLIFTHTNDVPYPLILPSFTMIAAYHKKLPQELMQDLNRTRDEVRQWTVGEYWSALNKGDALTPQERQNIIDKLNRYTGIAKDIINQANLRLDVRTFTHYLLADQLLRVGRLDGRYTGPDPQGFNEAGGFNDPTSSQTEPPFNMAFNDYVRRELGYRVDMPYYVSGQWSGIFNWVRSPNQPGGGTFGQGFQDTATPLREAMVKDRFLKVLVMEGYYDLATPFFGADYTMDHLNLPADYRKNISYATYESGHMVYLDSKSHAKLKQDWDNFIDATSKRGR